MKNTLTIFIILIFIKFGWGQKHDNIWLIGYLNYNPQYQSTGRAVIMFKDSIKVGLDSNLADLTLYGCDVVFSDSSGEKILFYSSGLELYNNKNNIIDNSEHLAPGIYWQLSKEVKNSGCIGGLLSLPYYYSDSLVVYFFHTGLGDVGTHLQTRSSLWLTKLLFDTLHPLGVVTEKNILLLDTLLLENPKAVKHANGKDWWIVVGESFTGRNYCYLLKDGILHAPVIYDFPEKIDQFTESEGIFTPDGTKFVRHGPDGIIIYDFDRCSGQISNPNICLYPKTQNYGGGTVFSSNSKWLYLMANTILWQVDMSKYPYTIDTAAVYVQILDGNIPTSLSVGELAPDGKIYINTFSTTRYMHVINNPDVGCPACDFVPNAIKMDFYNGLWGLPSFPNYRLGPLEGVNCDSLNYTSTVKKLDPLTVSPNPANDYFKLNYTGMSGFPREMELQLLDIAGKVVIREPLPIYSIYRYIDVSILSPGLYIWQVKDKREIMQTGKLVVMR